MGGAHETGAHLGELELEAVALHDLEAAQAALEGAMLRRHQVGPREESGLGLCEVIGWCGHRIVGSGAS